MGIPYKVRLSQDDSGMFSGWFLDSMTLTQISTSQEYFCTCGKWLAKDEEEGTTCREMPTEGDNIARPEKRKLPLYLQIVRGRLQLRQCYLCKLCLSVFVSNIVSSFVVDGIISNDSNANSRTDMYLVRLCAQ